MLDLLEAPLPIINKVTTLIRGNSANFLDSEYMKDPENRAKLIFLMSIAKWVFIVDVVIAGFFLIFWTLARL